jgi:hypothetical protein
MAKLTFFAQSAKDVANEQASGERLLNCYPEQVAAGGRTAFALRSVLGQATFATTGAVLVRAMASVNNQLYAVVGGSLYHIDKNAVVTSLGTIADDVETTISGNGTNVTVCAGGNYYVYDGASVTTPGSGRFSSEGTVGFIDQYTIITEKSGNEFEWTTVAIPGTRNAANFATNEGDNDNILRVHADGPVLIFMGEKSIEMWQNTGASNENAFARLPGGVINQGCLGVNLSTKLDSGVFFVGDDKACYIFRGAGLETVSGPGVVSAIIAETPTHVFYYEDRGHKFACVRFDSRPAWCYDLTTGAWHERGTGTGAWEVVATVNVYGQWYCGLNTGQIYEMSRTNTDISQALQRKMVSRSIYMAGDQFSVSELECLARVGRSNLGSDATVTLRTSRNNGETWGAQITQSLGDQGDYDTRAVFRALGSYRSFTAELSTADAADITFYSDANVRLT